MCSEKALVSGDSAENYQFLIQDEIQIYPWIKEYCMLHLVVVYFKDEIGSVWHISICFISDDNLHDTCFVYEVQKTMINYFHELLSLVKKLFYFSDGCGGGGKGVVKITKTSWIFVSTNRTLVYMQNGFSLPPATASHPVTELVAQ